MSIDPKISGFGLEHSAWTATSPKAAAADEAFQQIKKIISRLRSWPNVEFTVDELVPLSDNFARLLKASSLEEIVKKAHAMTAIDAIDDFFPRYQIFLYVLLGHIIHHHPEQIPEFVKFASPELLTVCLQSIFEISDKYDGDRFTPFIAAIRDKVNLPQTILSLFSQCTKDNLPYLAIKIPFHVDDLAAAIRLCPTTLSFKKSKDLIWGIFHSLMHRLFREIPKASTRQVESMQKVQQALMNLDGRLAGPFPLPIINSHIDPYVSGMPGLHDMQKCLDALKAAFDVNEADPQADQLICTTEEADRKQHHERMTNLTIALRLFRLLSQKPADIIKEYLENDLVVMHREAFKACLSAVVFDIFKNGAGKNELEIFRKYLTALTTNFDAATRQYCLEFMEKQLNQIHLLDKNIRLLFDVLSDDILKDWMP